MRSAHLGRDLRSAAPAFSCRDPFFSVLSKLDLSAWHGRNLIISPSARRSGQRQILRTQSSCDQAISSSSSSFSFPFPGTYVGMSYTDRPPAAWPHSEGHSSDPVSGWRSHLVHASILEEEEVTLIDIWNHKTIRSIPSRDPILLTVNLNYAVQCLGSGRCFREQRLQRCAGIEPTTFQS